MPESPRDELSRRLGQYPKSAVSYFNSGFVAASKLSDETHDRVLRALISRFKNGTRRISGVPLRPITGLGAPESEQLASIYSLVIGLLSDSSATPEDFVSSAKGILFLPEYEAAARSVAQAICKHRPEISTTVETAQLAGAVLPSLASFDVAVDLRVKVSDGTVVAGVPVAVTSINTDADGQSLCLQLSVGDLEDVIQKLSDSLEQMKVAETLLLRKK